MRLRGLGDEMRRAHYSRWIAGGDRRFKLEL